MTAKQQTCTAAGIRRLLAEHEESELSLAAFAREKGIAPYRLYDARRRSRLLRQNRDLPDRGTFAEVLVKDPAGPSSAPLELKLPSGYAIQLAPDFDEVTLRRLLGVLGSCRASRRHRRSRSSSAASRWTCARASTASRVP